MTDVRSQLDEQMGTPPPATIDLDAVILGQRRRTRLRQAGVGVSIAALASAAALLATALVGGSSGRQPDGSPAGAPSGNPASPPAGSAPAVSPAPVSSTAPASGARQADAARLSTILQRLMHEALPDAQFERSPIETAPAETTTAPLVFVDAGTYFIAMAKITDAAGVSNIIVRIGKTDDGFVHADGCLTDPPPEDLALTCHPTPLSGGSVLVQMKTSRGAWLRDVAEIVRPGGQVVDVEIANSVHGYQAERPTLNLTLAQLAALAQEPQFAPAP
jgi:hypothetical protein